MFFTLYFLTPKKFRNLTALLFSIVFYAWGAPKFVYVLLASTIADFYLVQWMDRTEEKRKKNLLLGISIFLNVGLLLYFKYANFFVENVNHILSLIGVEAFAWTEVLLPIGISFYTFQTLTYSIDVYRKVHAPLKNVWDYLLYIMLFPQMIAGPIVRFNHIADQITERQSNYEDRVLGWNRFILGLSKKVLIANRLGEYVDDRLGTAMVPILSNDWTFGTGESWLIISAYTMQIYFDFSGYSDMAIGLGRIMGFRFPENFDNPYISKSITEFWRRWHMTLGTWMRDYLYIPLGGNRVESKGRLYFNLIFVFLVSGLWHGDSWNFVIWGALHGMFLILDRIFLLNIYKKIGGFLSTIITLFIVMIAWVFFRIESLDEALIFIERLFVFEAGSISYLPNELIPMLSIAFFFAFFTYFDFGKKIQENWFIHYKTNGQVILVSSTSFILFILCLAYLSSSGFNPFIYFRF